MIIAIALVALARTASVAGAGTDATGWWWTRQRDDISVPPPPWVPTGGLYVATSLVDDGGIEAVAALRWTLAAAQRPATLALGVASVSGAPTVQACRSTGAWTSEHAAPFARRPAADCEGAPTGTMAAGGSTMTFDLALLETSAVDLVLVPAASGASSHIAFDQPGDDALSTTTSPSTTSTTRARATPTTAPTQTRASPTSTLAVTDSAVSTATPHPAIAPPAVNESPAPTTDDTTGADGPAIGALGVLAVAAMALAAWRLPRPEITGLARFSKPRTGRHPRLR